MDNYIEKTLNFKINAFSSDCYIIVKNQPLLRSLLSAPETGPLRLAPCPQAWGHNLRLRKHQSFKF